MRIGGLLRLGDEAGGEVAQGWFGHPGRVVDVEHSAGDGRDPATDDPELLRTVMQLLRISALTASSRADRDGIHTADEKIAEALGMLCKIDDIKKIAGTLRQHAGKIEQQSDDVRTALTRLLSQAQSALSIAAEDTHNAA